jgi:hypothetical protein
VAVGSASESYTLSSPLFSPTNTRPSGANAATVGVLSPPMATLSVKPGGVTVAVAVAVVRPVSAAPARQRADVRIPRRRKHPGTAQVQSELITWSALCRVPGITLR